MNAKHAAASDRSRDAIEQEDCEFTIWKSHEILALLWDFHLLGSPESFNTSSRVGAKLFLPNRSGGLIGS